MRFADEPLYQFYAADISEVCFILKLLFEDICTCIRICILLINEFITNVFDSINLEF